MFEDDLKETRQRLQLNNEAIPPIEEYLSRKAQLQKAYVSWLNQEPLSRHVCYVDLTFEIPNLNVITLIMGPEEQGTLDNYIHLLRNFIDGGHTLYGHAIFQKGIPKYQDRNGYFVPQVEDDLYQRGSRSKVNEQFLLCDLGQTENKGDQTWAAGNNAPVKLKFAEFDLTKQYADLGVNYLSDVNSKPIEAQWNSWKTLHTERRHELLSPSGAPLRWVLSVPLGIVFEDDNYIPIGSVFLGMDEMVEEKDVIDYLRILVLCLTNSSFKFYFRKHRADIHNVASHELGYILSALNEKTPAALLPYIRTSLQLYLTKKVEFKLTGPAFNLLDLLKEFIDETLRVHKIVKMALTGDFQDTDVQIQSYLNEVNEAIILDDDFDDYTIINDTLETSVVRGNLKKGESNIGMFKAAFMAGLTNAIKHTEGMEGEGYKISITEGEYKNQKIIQIFNSFNYNKILSQAKMDVHHANDLNNTKSFMSIRTLVDIYGGDGKQVKIESIQKEDLGKQMVRDTWVTQIPIPVDNNIIFNIP